ncbi:hypothetical protein [Moorena producens]|uniref:hypothetical protein n=1 Tax=Moorena producens TaxID=1155739 RepID=UPI003C74F4B0
MTRAGGTREQGSRGALTYQLSAISYQPLALAISEWPRYGNSLWATPTLLEVVLNKISTSSSVSQKLTADC